MNGKQQTAIALGAVAVVVLALFPPFVTEFPVTADPWDRQETTEGTPRAVDPGPHSQVDVEFGWFLSRPTVRYIFDSGPAPGRETVVDRRVRLDWARAFLLLAGIVATTFAAVVLLATPRSANVRRRMADTFD